MAQLVWKSWGSWIWLQYPIFIPKQSWFPYACSSFERKHTRRCGSAWNWEERLAKIDLRGEESFLPYQFFTTFSEFTAPTGEWKSIVGLAWVFISPGFWIYVLEKLFLYKPMPSSFSEASKKAQLKRMIDLRVNPIGGISSNYDYEKEEWKK